MTTAVRAASREAVPASGAGAAGVVGAFLACASALVHVLHLDGATLGSLAMLALALGCLPCAWHLLRRPSPQVWRLTALADVTMLLVHLETAGAEGDAHHGAAHAGLAGTVGPVGLVLVSSQLVLSLGVLGCDWSARRARSVRPEV